MKGVDVVLANDIAVGSTVTFPIVDDCKNVEILPHVDIINCPVNVVTRSRHADIIEVDKVQSVEIGVDLVTVDNVQSDDDDVNTVNVDKVQSVNDVIDMSNVDVVLSDRDTFMRSSQVSESEDQVSHGKEQIGIYGSVDNEPVEVFDPMTVCLLVWLFIWLCGLLHRLVCIVKAPVVDYDFEVLGRMTHYTDIDERFKSNDICQISGKPRQKSTVIIKDETVYCPEAVPGIIRTLNKKNYGYKN